jgi:hypothetical protein
MGFCSAVHNWYLLLKHLAEQKTQSSSQQELANREDVVGKEVMHKVWHLTDVFPSVALTSFFFPPTNYKVCPMPGKE